MFKVSAHKPLGTIDWYNLRSSLNLNPVYQRKSYLWKDEKQAGLIDSILNDYDIPKFYVADFRSYESSLNTAHTKYAVIDGKQRFLALFRFFDGELRLSKRFILREDPSAELAGMDYLQLKQEHALLADKLESYKLDVFSVVTDDPSRIEELFVRLNFGVAVNGPERRNAMPGPVPELIRKLVKHPFLKENISFSTQRMGEFNVAAKLLLIEFREDFADTKAQNLDRFADESDGLPQGDLKQAYARCTAVLDKMSEVFKSRDPILKNAGGIPVYYWIVRSHATRARRFRPFLDKFLVDVKKNLELSRTDPERANQELSTYYTMGRTTNDEASLSGRYAILEKRFLRHVK